MTKLQSTAAAKSAAEVTDLSEVESSSRSVLADQEAPAVECMSE